MNDGEWELLSIPSHYWQMHQDDTHYAHIRFNVRASLSDCAQSEWSDSLTLKEVGWCWFLMLDRIMSQW